MATGMTGRAAAAVAATYTTTGLHQTEACMNGTQHSAPPRFRLCLSSNFLGTTTRGDSGLDWLEKQLSRYSLCCAAPPVRAHCEQHLERFKATIKTVPSCSKGSQTSHRGRATKGRTQTSFIVLGIY